MDSSTFLDNFGKYAEEAAVILKLDVEQVKQKSQAALAEFEPQIESELNRATAGDPTAIANVELLTGQLKARVAAALMEPAGQFANVFGLIASVALKAAVGALLAA